MLDEFARFLDDNPFEEIPVDARTFVESKDFLGQPALSKIQYDIVESMAQIYKQEDVERIMGAVEGRKYYNKYTKTEIIMALGKGSGKDFTSTVGVAYVVYKLLCLKDPARYYGKPPGDAIDIINIAINAQQAKNVFFKGFKNKIERSPWFAGRYYSKMDSIEFDKAITVYSGHSERESHEGLNLFMSILDEISGFGENANNIELGKSGANIYKAFRGTVDSRFPDYGKVVLLSFTRYEGDFISKKYDESIAEKEVVERKHTFIVNPDLPEDYPDNTFTIEWEEDHITKYKVPHVFALKRPTWEVNPTRSIDDFKIAFYTDPADAKMRFLCLEENQKVWTSQGMQNIGDTRVGDLIESRFGPTRILRKETDKKECVLIKLKNGQEITCTPDHKILKVTTVRRGVGENGVRHADRLGQYATRWTEAGLLTSKDKVLLGNGNALYSDNGIDEATAYLLGLILADGNVRNDTRAYVNIACGTGENYAKEVLALMKQVTGFGQIQTQIPDPKLSTKTQYNVYSGKRSVAEFFSNLGIKRVPAQEKQIPDIVWGMNRKSIMAFISGFVDGDGTVSNQSGCVAMYSTSKKMLQQLQLLLKATTGVTSQIGVSSKPKTGVVTSNYILYGLRLNKAETLIVLPELTLLAKNRPGPNPFKDKNKGRFLRQFAEVVSVDGVGIKNVVDIQTEVGEFVSNGVVVHNCQPTVSSDAFFRNKEKLQNAMSIRNPLDSNRRIEETWKPNPDKVYFVHADLAQRVDKCAVAVSHVERWVQVEVMNQYTQIVPLVVVDMIAWWEPSKHGPVNLSDVKNWIINLRRRGVNLGLVTFDRWNCLVSDTTLITQDGPKNISDVVPGDMVSTVAGMERVSNVFDNGVRDVFKVTSKLGYSLVGTGNHPIMTPSGYKTISQLSKGDLVGIKSSCLFGEESLDKDLAWALGFIVGDGWMEANRLVVDGIDKEVLDRLKLILNERFSYTKSDIKVKNESTDSWNKCYRFSFTSKEFGKFVSDNYPSIKSRSADKKIESVISNGGRETQIAFISGLVEAEGTIQQYGNDRRVEVEMTSPIVLWLHQALLNLGVTASLSSRERPPFKKSYRVSAKGQRGNELLEFVSLYSHRKQEAKEKYLSITPSRKPRWSLNEEGIAWLPITSIESQGQERVYDICVPGSHSFVANGFVTHNSFDIQQELREVGIRSETLSVGKKHYEDLAMLVYEDRVVLPHIELLLQELTELKVVNDKKVDHPRKGCFVGETRIPLLDGTRPTIAELEGKEVWVYSAKEDGTIVPGKARGRFTKMVDELIDVVLDTGAVVRCTPDHLWMLRNGDYKEAKDLRPGIDRLMPINQVWPVNGGYERVTDKNGVKTLTHHMVVGAPSEGHVVHHKNHIKTDNRPENLEVVSLEEHSRQHTTGRHDDEEYREALYAGLKKWNSLDSTKKKRSEYMKSRSKDWYKSKARSAKSFRSDITIDSLLSVADDNEATSANAAARILNCGRNVVVRVLKDHGYESWQELTEQTGNNHKVRHVTPVKLNSPVPVYDLEVDEWHNFALSSGVFVHNSKDLSDAMCGAVFNAISRTIRDIEPEIEIHTWAKGEDKQAIVEKEKPEVTEEVKEYLMNFGML